MSKLSDIFYIFSKFLTSLVLLILLIFTGYALYKSYKGVDDISLEFNNTLINISKEIENNSIKIDNYKNFVDDNKIALQKIKDNFLNQENEKKILKLEKDNKVLLEKIETINDALINLKTKTNIETNIDDIGLVNDSDYIENINDEQITSLKVLILSKYKEGRDIKSDFQMLYDFSKKTSPNIFEKLYIIQSEVFYGKEKLKINFDISLEKYVKQKFLNKNQNSVTKFLFKFIDIKPNNLNSYEDTDLNILVSARNHLDFEEYQDSLKQVLLLNDSTSNIFKEWVNQISLLIEFDKYLSRVE